MTGAIVAGIAVVLALAFGLYRRLTDGRARAVARTDRLTPGDLGADLGPHAPFVQFSTAVCAPCRGTRALLGTIAAAVAGVVHVELDAESRLELVDRFDVTRTPTVLVLDAKGTVRHRIVGAPRKAEVLEVLQGLAA